ncbi:hypothetical protein EEB14_41000 [Rhodococcus sp. WS4]|nr:hypothetical protein EEB14_41000 [Rhodococcus sp. WS4]
MAATAPSTAVTEPRTTAVLKRVVIAALTEPTAGAPRATIPTTGAGTVETLTPPTPSEHDGQDLGGGHQDQPHADAPIRSAT